MIETLVAMLTGLVVTGALFAILEVSLHQSARAFDRVQATQLGRTAMTRIVNALHSACIAPGFNPVQENSNASELLFINAYSENALITSATEHQIIWNEAAGTLTDFRYASKVETGSEWPNFKFPALDYSTTTHEAANATPTKGVLLATNIAQSEPQAKEGKEPIFQYYKYATKTSSAGENLPVGTLNPTPLTVPLSSASAESTASVLVRFRAGATDGNKALNRSADLSGQVTFAFSAPSSEIPITASPCE